MYGMLFVCYLVRRLVCTLLGVLLNMLLYAWLGMLLDSTLLGDTSLMCRWYVLGVIGCCVIACCHCLVQVVFRWYRAVGITFVHIENPEKDIQMTNWMMISKKVKKFNKILVSSSRIIPYLFSYLCWYRAHMLLATNISQLIYTPAEKNMTTEGLNNDTMARQLILMTPCPWCKILINKVEDVQY